MPTEVMEADQTAVAGNANVTANIWIVALGLLRVHFRARAGRLSVCSLYRALTLASEASGLRKKITTNYYYYCCCHYYYYYFICNI